MTSLGRPVGQAGRGGLAALLLGLTLSACGGETIHVERATALPRDAGVAPFVVLRAKGQDGAKEFAGYADQVAARLVAKGFTRVEQPAQARLALMLAYDGDGAGWVFEDIGKSPKDLSKRDENAVDRTVSVTLFDLTRPKRTDEEVFSGRAQATVETTTHDTILIPALFDAVLRDFPGSGHESYTVSLPKMD